MTCRAVHPEDPKLSCVLTSPRHPQHIAVTYPLDEQGKRSPLSTGWVNTDYVSPHEQHKAADAAADTVTRLADHVRASGTLSGATDNRVQLAGAQAGLPKSGTNRWKCLKAIHAAGANGLTFEELGEQIDMSYSHCGPRVRELVRDGFVVDSGATRLSSSQAEQSVWKSVVGDGEF